MPRKCRKKRIMIVVDEREPVGELPPPFPSRNIKVKQDEDIRKLYDLKKEIGRGRFGTVYMVEDKATGQKFAAKFVSTKRNQDRANVQREVEIMKALNSERSHPRLIQLYDVYEMAKEMCLVLEIVDGGELFERVIDDDFLLTERACTVFIRQICEGIEFIHSKNILHLDMKPENILCLSREGNRIKICDFGLARRYDPRKKLQVLFGTPEFVAPEVVNFEPISYGTDMWSVGVICYVLLSGLSPFMGHNYVETMTNVTHNKYDFEDEAFDSVSEDAKDFIQKMLVLDKSLRLTPAQCQRHEWLRKPPGSRTLRRSRFFACSDSESGSETEDSDECSESESEEETIVERIAREEKIKREQEFMAPEANRKEMDKQIEDKKRELEKIKKKEEEDKRLKEEAEAKRKAVEEEIEENKRREAEKIRREERQEEERREREADRRKKEAERKQKEEAERKQKEEAERKQKEEAERKQKEEAERKQKEVEKRKKEEAERKERESEQKKEEQLERTKKQLKEFVERWNSHPNSPYLVGTPLPFDLQRIVSIGGWDSRTSVSSMAVAPPTDLPDPKVLDEDVFIFNDFDNGTSQGILINEVDNQEDEEFTMYKINPPEPKQPPSDVARQLEIKLKILQQENKISEGEGAVADVEESGKESNRSTRKLSDITNKNKENVHTSEESCKSKGSKKADGQKSSVEINIEDIMSKKRVVQIPDKMRGEQMEKHKKAYEERKRKQSLEQMRDKTAEELKQEEESKEKEKIKKVILPIKRTKSRLSQEPIEAEKIINDILQVDHKSAYEEYKKMMNDVAKYSGGSNNTDQKCEIVVNGIQNGKENIQRSVNNNVDLKKKEQEKIDHQTVKQTNTKKDEKVINNSTEKMTPKQLQRQVSDATKASELKFGGSGKGDALQLKRPEILALQNEEIGGILPRQRKKSTTQVDQPNIEDSNFSPRGSRGSTPIKQLKKMPSRDVPLQSSNPIPIPVEDGASLQCQQSLEPSSSPRCKTLSRGHSRDDRPPSRESDRGGRPGNRRPSRDVPLNSAQMERLLSASCLGSPDLISPAPQAWPDLIVAPQGEEDNEELDDYKDSLDVPVAKLVKSPSGTLISVPGLKVSQDDRPPAARRPASPPAASPSLCSRGESFSDDPAYVSKNKMVAWILDIGTNQLPQAQSACTTNKRVNQWESRSPSPRLTPSPTSDHSPKCHEISPLPPDQGREKSPQATQNLPPIKPMSREPSSDNLCINTPWGTLRRSPSNLSKSSSSDVSANSARDTSPAALTKSASQSQHSEGKERPISPRPPAGRLQRQMATDKCTSHISDEIQPKPPETSHERWQQEGRNQGDTKSHTLPRPSKLTKQQSLANFTTYSGNNRNEAKKLSPLDISKEFDDEDSQGLKRKSKFPTSPNHKKKIGPMLFSAQDRISQFENQKPINGTKQLPLTRTRSSINLTLSSDCPLERSKSGININGSKTGDKTQIGFLRTRLLDKGGKAVVASLPEEPDIIPTSRHTLTRFKT